MLEVSVSCEPKNESTHTQKKEKEKQWTGLNRYDNHSEQEHKNTWQSFTFKPYELGGKTCKWLYFRSIWKLLNPSGVSHGAMWVWAGIRLMRNDDDDDDGKNRAVS